RSCGRSAPSTRPRRASRWTRTAAALLVGLDAGTRGGVAAALIGVLAVLVGRFPGGPYEALRTTTERLRLRRAPALTPVGARARRLLRPEPRTARAAPVPVGATATGAGTSRTGGRPPASPVPRTPPAPTAPLLTARHLHARYGGFTALHGVDLDLSPGRITAVVGPNGAGKSTLFHCLAGTRRPARGAVRLGGRDITALPAHARARLGVARTFQQLAVFPSLSVAENVRVGAEQGRLTDRGAVERTLRLLGLDGPVRALPAAALPTGTLRRVELARVLAGSPRVLLLDEPAAGLDTAEVAALARVLKALAADGTALLVVEHDLDLVAGLADVVHVMTAGRIVASGPPERVLDALGTGADR
ncbi:ABC transporter ATP-binding protein, partial [Streptomyces sp. NPDC006129]|uniref:ABC transporter ATP-binding protein n=1 Tax=Streptomyces sp. NPDC006129 TaxID=3155348 RepID=UPI00339F1470